MSRQLEFDFDAPVRLPRYDNPSGDNELMLTLQARWLEDGDTSAESELSTEARKMAERCVMGLYKARGIKYTREDVDDRASSALLYVMRRYRNPSVKCRTKNGWKTTYKKAYGWNYCVLKDFVSVIRQGVRHAVDWRSKSEQIMDYVDYETLAALVAGVQEESGEDYFMP